MGWAMLASTAGDSNYVRDPVQRMLVSEVVDFKPAQIAGGNNAVDLATRIFGTKGVDFSLAHRIEVLS
jgi:hypothetical protein